MNPRDNGTRSISEPKDAAEIFTPITDCEHKNADDGCCSHPKNMTPECHVDACPRLHPMLRLKSQKRTDWKALGMAEHHQPIRVPAR